MIYTAIALVVVFLAIAYLYRARASQGFQGLLVGVAGLLTALLAVQILAHFLR